MTSTHDFLRKLARLTIALDENVRALGGYAVSFKHYDHAIGEYDLSIQAFPDTAQEGQTVADVLGIPFVQDEDRKHSYVAKLDGIRIAFMLDYKDVDTSVYPEVFIPNPKAGWR